MLDRQVCDATQDDAEYDPDHSYLWVVVERRLTDSLNLKHFGGNCEWQWRMLSGTVRTSSLLLFPAEGKESSRASSQEIATQQHAALEALRGMAAQTGEPVCVVCADMARVGVALRSSQVPSFPFRSVHPEHEICCRKSWGCRACRGVDPTGPV